MARVLDLRTVELPELELTLLDDNFTTIHVTMPTEALINELENISSETLRQMAAGDRSTIESAYDLTGRLISCNKEGITITAEDLRGKYHVEWLVLLVLLKDYMSFINEIKAAKN